jgi:ChpA-C
MIKKVVAVTAAAGGLMLAGAGLAVADSGAAGSAAYSPGVLAGNFVQVPIHVPVNVCGNTVSVIGLLNPAFGNVCVNASHH